jgi:intein/homing endonuclease
MINANPSWGKAQPGYSLIRVPGGWKTMYEIAPGDLVITPNNKTSTVLNKYNHTDKPIYEITLLDDRVVHCCEDHLWSVYKNKSKNMEVLSTKQIIQENRLLQEKRIYLPLTSAISDTHKTHIIHPYVLGILLGDGGITSGSVMVSSADEEIINRVQELLPELCSITHASKYDYRITDSRQGKNLITDELRRLGLMGLGSHDKFIPEEYMFDSLENKLQLLQGLLDSDGNIEISGKIEFSSTSKKLMDAFAELVYSIGGSITISSRTTQYTHNNERRLGRVSYRGRVSRIPWSIKTQLFYVGRKKARIKEGKWDSLGKIPIKSIEKIENDDCFCIEIDSEDKLYLTDSYIVTHNTFTALAIAGKLGQKTLVVTHTVPLRNQWVKECEKVFGFKPGIIGSGSFDISKPVTVGNTQTLSRKIPEISREFGTILLDEMHHTSSPTFSTIIDKSYARYKIGLSGTLRRKDGKHVVFRDYFGDKIYVPPEENRMTPVVHIYKTKIQFQQSGPWAIRVNKLMSNPEYVHLVAMISAKYAVQGHNVLTLADRVEFIENVVKLVGPNGVAVTGKVKDERDLLISQVGTKYNMLGGIQSIFSEGISHSPFSCLVLGTPVNNEPLLEQLIGRVVRELKDKKNPVIVDINLTGHTAERQAMARMGHYMRKGYKMETIWI